MSVRILIVDDEFGLADVIAEILIEHGYAVDVAINGELGLEAAAQRRPDVALIDNMMPVMDGVTMAQKMRADPQLASIPLIVMTAVPEALPKDSSPFDAMLRKPFSPDDLVAVIQRLLQK